MNDPTAEIYTQIGNDAPFYELVDVFYAGVDTDPQLRPLYPADLTQAKEHLALFLIQRFGGHTQYQAKRGHPRLRMRHIPFQIGVAESEAWLRHMFHAVDTVSAFAPFRSILKPYFSESAAFLINHSEVPSLGPAE